MTNEQIIELFYNYYNPEAVEKDNKVFRILLEKRRDLKIGGDLKVTNVNISSWLENNRDKLFDIIVADPPFDNLQ